MYEAVACPMFAPLPGGEIVPWRRRGGFGQFSSSAQEGEALGGAAASTAVGTLVAAGAVAGPVGAAIGAGLALVTTAINAILNSGCGQTCVEASEWANQAEPLLLQNINAYFAQPAPRSASSQQAAIQNFTNVWNTLVSQCSQAGTGQAGVNCIADRQSGACKWKQTATSSLLAYVPYGEPNVGQCWNWWSGYHDPIANDPDVTADESSALANGAVDTTASVLSSLGISSGYAIPALIGAAVLVAFLVLK